MFAVHWQVAVPVRVSRGSTRPIEEAVQRTALPLSRLTNVTVALRISPAFGSLPGSTTVMSWIVAASVTVALFVEADAQAKVAPAAVWEPSVKVIGSFEISALVELSVRRALSPAASEYCAEVAPLYFSVV